MIIKEFKVVPAKACQKLARNNTLADFFQNGQFSLYEICEEIFLLKNTIKKPTRFNIINHNTNILKL